MLGGHVTSAGFALALVLATALAAPDAAAQTDQTDQSDTIEEIVVMARTGSRISRQSDSPSPLTIHEGPDLTDAGLKDIRDVVGVLSINAGSENNSDNLSQNYTVGTANVNLRGLGVASTLVLVNGRRQVLSSAQTDDGFSFVDLAGLAPMLAIERVEILKDGAAAIYGSEAVAGVVNFITRGGYNGFELRTEFRTRTSEGSQEDLTVDAVYGGEFAQGEGDFLVAASYLDRTSLILAEVDWLAPSTSGFGNPASFNVPSTGQTVADPGCARYEGLLQQLSGGAGEICRFDYAPQITTVPNERRLQLWGQGDWNRGGKTALWAEFGYARNDINREVSPSFPVLNTPVVPAYHPANPYGEDVFFQGRPYGYAHPPEVNYYEHETLRFAAGMEGELTDSASWNVSVVYGANDALQNPRDVHIANFQAALNGFGGSGCAPGPDRTPGQGGCLFFNPFSSNFAAEPGSPLANGRELYEFIIGDFIGLGDSRLTTVEANVNGDLPVLGGAYAVGAQHRKQTLDFRYDTVTRQDGWAFLIGNPNFDADDSVYAVYGEAWLPLTDSLEVTGALRYEDYGSGVGNTLDPKVTLLYRPSDAWSLRGSYSTSFRAPSPFQTRGAQTNFTNIVDYDASRTFAGRRTVGDPTLQPETSSAYNLGVTWQGSATWALSADFWRYEFEDVLRKENAQAIVNADPFDPRIERTSAGTITIVNVAFINADRIETTGVDLSARGTVDTGAGLFSGWAEATWLFSYDVTNAGVEIDALGKLNRANVGAPNQRFRGAAGLSWTRGAWEVNGLVRHIGGYEDDGGGSIDSFTTLDANVRWSFGGFFGVGADNETTLTLGAANLLDQDPPYVAIGGNYDPRSADPRGRRIFLGFRIRTQ
ncbi:MAG: TonB-dependent receptor [Gammaproteobacteria bacterium]|nr:TonB-dependent receptor [Gammaproteobacteria bacterium]MYF66526.1 TonB-dependent receptor [Gammaproteobacteria bacterium]MYK37162.1 TonB-dependent receptor [Gammaproteobacteria bacterium]